MNRRTAPIALWIVSIAYACALAFCLLLMTGSCIAIVEGLSKAIGLIIAGVGLAGCLVLLLLGGVAIVAAATVFVMRKLDGRAARRSADGEKKPD